MPARPKHPIQTASALALLLCLMALPGFACGLISTPTPSPAPENGAEAPNFRLATPLGDKIELSQLRGKVVIITFWVSWCQECIQDLGFLQAAYEKHQADNLIVLGINSEDSARKMIQFSQEHGITFPLLLDPNHEIADQYHLTYYPTTFLIDPSGSLQSQQVGPLDVEKFEKELAGLFSVPRMSSFLLREAFDASTSSLAAATEPPPPPTPTPTITHLEGCVASNGLKARSAPQVDGPVLTYFNHGDCFRFDGRNADGTWLRLGEEWIKNRQSLWVSAAFIDLQGEPLRLPVVSPDN